MRISIAMTTYNGAKYLQEQLGSFLIQTRLPDELVVCDDGSTDDTMQILHDFRETAPFAVIIERNALNLGFTKNFEKAASLCTGDIVFLSDQDDIWYPDKLKQVESTFISNPDIALVIHDGDIVDGELVSGNVTKLQQIRSGYGNDDALVMGGLTAIRRDLLQHLLPIPAGIVGHDVWFHDVSRLLNTRLVLDKTLQLIRRHGDNTSNWIVSSNKRINRFDVFMSDLGTQPAESYVDRMVTNRECARLISEISVTSGQFSASAAKRSLAHLESERVAIIKREQLLKDNSIARRISAVKLMCSGGYAHFNGVRSFLRDILR